MSTVILKYIIIGTYSLALIITFYFLFHYTYILYKIRKNIKPKETMNCGICGKERELLKHIYKNGKTDLWCYCGECRINTFHPSMLKYPRINHNSLESQK